MQLHGFEISEDNLCKFCKHEPETLMHLYCEYKIAILFWNNVSDWILSTLGINFVRYTQNILFGFKNERQIFQFNNYYVLDFSFTGRNIQNQNPMWCNILVSLTL